MEARRRGNEMEHYCGYVLQLVCSRLSGLCLVFINFDSVEPVVERRNVLMIYKLKNKLSR